MIHEVWALDNTVNRKCPMALKDLGTFCNTKHNVHRFTLNSLSLKKMMVGFPSLCCRDAVVSEKMVQVTQIVLSQ